MINFIDIKHKAAMYVLFGMCFTFGVALAAVLLYFVAVGLAHFP